MECVVVPFEDSLLVDGLGQLRSLRLPGINAFLPNLIQLMDGTRTFSDLLDRLPEASPEQLAHAVEVLEEQGLVQAVSANTGPAAKTDGQAVQFLRRINGTSKNNPTGDVAFHRLNASKILLLSGAGPPAAEVDLLRSLLIDGGVGEVSATEESLPVGAELRETLPVSIALKGETFARNSDLDHRCRELDLDWLHIAIDETRGRVDLGPLFHSAEAPCYRCFHEMHGGPENSLEPQAPLTTSGRRFWLALAAAEILYLLGRVGPALNPRGFRRYDLRTWKYKDVLLAGIPGCEYCRPLPGYPGSSHQIFTAQVFEDAVALPAHLLPVFRAEQERTHGNVNLMRQRKQLSVCRQIPLTGLSAEHHAPATGITLSELAAALRLTAGIRSLAENGQPQRWNPTGGNLGSVELYVVSNDVKDLPNGFYFYQPYEHTLSVLEWRTKNTTHLEFIHRVLGEAFVSRSHALVIFTGAYHRVSRKYGPFAYRLVNLDAGAAQSQLAIVAQALRIQSEVAPIWPDDLIESELHLEHWKEQCTGVAALYRDSKKDDASGPIANVSSSSNKQAKLESAFLGKPPATYSGLSTAEVVELLYQESRTLESKLSLDRERLTPSRVPTSRPTLHRIHLPTPQPASVRVDAVLAKRHSVRQFSAKGVSLDQVSRILTAASTPEGSPSPLSVLVLARKVTGLQPALYEYVGESNSLGTLQPLTQTQTLSDLYIQPEFADAPLQVWIIGNLQMACATQGETGHRRLLVQAGVTAHRVWMAALETDLAGTIVAGLVHGAARKMFGFDGSTSAAIVAVPIGHRAEQ